MKSLQINEKDARRLYKEGSSEFRTVLETTFGEEFFNSKVTDRVKTYEDACEELGEQPLDEPTLLKLGVTPHEIITRRLETITKALNGGKVIDVYSSEDRWFPYFYHNGSPSAFAFDDSSYAYSHAIAGSGSRLSFVSKELSNYAGTQFTDLYRQLITE